MKVGTDGVLLGAWANVAADRSILDVGCGSGLIALMVAQRAPEARVTGIDIDVDSVEQARENAQASPFTARVECLQADVRTYNPPCRYSHIVSNPPFFEEDTLPPDKARMCARNASALPLEDLLEAAGRLLEAEGRFSLILPCRTAERFVTLALVGGWSVERMCSVWTVSRKPPRRMLLTLSRNWVGEAVQEQLVLNAPDGKRSEAYQKLCGEFYL